MTNILIADDESDVREYLSDELAAVGYDVSTVANGVEAVAAVAHGCFDAVVLDLFMPGLTGIEVAKRLRKLAPGLPIVGVTGYTGAAHLAPAAAMGITWLNKPIDVNDLIMEIGYALMQAGRRF